MIYEAAEDETDLAPGRKIAKADAMKHVWGYTIVNDVTARDVQGRLKQWLVGKSFDTFCPMSDLVPAAAVGPTLDPVLEAYVELDRSRDELLAEFDAATVERTLSLVDRAEYKRRQYPPGTKVSARAFGKDRRLPITNKWRENS